MRNGSNEQGETAGLLRASQVGDRAALGALLERYLPSVRAFVRLRMGPLVRARESESDIVQSVCADLFSAHGVVFADEAAFRGWLYVAALNKLRNYDRHARAQKRAAAREEGSSDVGDEVVACYAAALSPSEEAMGRERIARLEAAFDQLPEHYREVVTLAKIAGLTYEQVASSMGRTPDSIRNLLARALTKLAGLLDEEPCR